MSTEFHSFHANANVIAAPIRAMNKILLLIKSIALNNKANVNKINVLAVIDFFISCVDI